MTKLSPDQKDLLTLGETKELYHFSSGKFSRFIAGNDDLPFLIFYRKRKLVVRKKLDKYLEEHPERKEELKRAWSRKHISTTERLKASPFAQRRIHPA